jgi:hypothetical protein
MHPLQIVIKEDGYDIYDQEAAKSLVSDISSMDEALLIFQELTSSTKHPPSDLNNDDWFMIPGVLLQPSH